MIFLHFLKNLCISNFALEHRGTDLLCQRIFLRICDVAYEEERSWSGINRTVLKMYGAPNHISLNHIIYCYPPREEPAQKEERSTSILRHKFKKTSADTPILRRGAGTQICSRNFFFLNLETQHAKNAFENRFSIPLRFT